MKSFLFAYGTLQPAKAPPEIRGALRSLHPVGKAVAPGAIYDLGDYPGAVFDERRNGTVKGMVFRLPENSEARRKLLTELDEYEGVNPKDPAQGLFIRRQLPVSLRNGHRVNCWVYEYNGAAPADGAIFDGQYVGPRKNRRTSPKRITSKLKVSA